MAVATIAKGGGDEILGAAGAASKGGKAVAGSADAAAIAGKGGPSMGKVVAGGAAVGAGVGLLTNNPIDVANGALNALGMPSLGPSLSGCSSSSCFILIIIGIVRYMMK
jgi:hypothetical protein